MTLKSEVYVSHGGAWEMVGTSYPEPLHNNTVNRNLVDAHPLISVSNLSAILDGKAVVGHTHTNHRISTVSAAAPASPAAGDMWCNSGTNAVQVWSGSAWVNPKFWVGTRWDNYRPPAPVIGPISYAFRLEEAHITNSAGADLAAWGFDADAQGWYPSSGDPIYWVPGGLEFHLFEGGGTTNYTYSPEANIANGTHVNGWAIATLISWDSNSTKPPSMSCNMYYDGLKWGEPNDRIFNYVGESARWDFVGGAVSGFGNPHFQAVGWGYAVDPLPAQTIIPQYWNGSAWIAQSAV